MREQGVEQQIISNARLVIQGIERTHPRYAWTQLETILNNLFELRSENLSEDDSAGWELTGANRDIFFRLQEALKPLAEQGMSREAITALVSGALTPEVKSEPIQPNLFTHKEETVRRLIQMEGERWFRDQQDFEDENSIEGAIKKAKGPEETGMIFGESGYNRYFVKKDGSVKISESHIPTPKITLAVELGFMTQKDADWARKRS